MERTRRVRCYMIPDRRKYDVAMSVTQYAWTPEQLREMADRMIEMDPHASAALALRIGVKE